MMKSSNKLFEPTPESVVALRGCLLGGAAQQRRYVVTNKMEIESYNLELQEVAAQLSPSVEEISISGKGKGSFIVVTKGKYGIEIYKDENDKVFIDPAIEDELLGEKMLPNYDIAIKNALIWLNEGKIE